MVISNGNAVKGMNMRFQLVQCLRSEVHSPAISGCTIELSFSVADGTSVVGVLGPTSNWPPFSGCWQSTQSSALHDV